MSRRLAAIEQICLDTLEEIQQLFEQYTNNQIKWVHFERKRDALRNDAFTRITKFLGVTLEDQVSSESETE